MGTVAISMWTLGVIILCVVLYLSQFRWGVHNWSPKKAAIEFALIIVGSVLVLAGIGTVLFAWLPELF